MKQVIEKLSFAAFKRWFESPSISKEHAWKSLCAEAEKREPRVWWMVDDKVTDLSLWSTEKEALAYAKCHNGTVIKLVEAEKE